VLELIEADPKLFEPVPCQLQNKTREKKSAEIKFSKTSLARYICLFLPQAVRGNKSDNTKRTILI
jgi:hypothetical protein